MEDSKRIETLKQPLSFGNELKIEEIMMKKKGRFICFPFPALNYERENGKMVRFIGEIGGTSI